MTSDADSNDSELWFDDGTVVLSANKSRSGTLVRFCIHKSILSKHSPIFKDMFSMPCPNDIDLYADIPLVHLPDDAEDLRAFLKFMYDPCFMPVGQYLPESPTVMHGPFKLATKYQADQLQSRILQQLRLDWPSSLGGYDCRLKSFSRDPTQDRKVFSPSIPLPEDYKPYMVISMLRDAPCRQEAAGVLALAYYETACTLSFAPPEPGFLTDDDYLKIIIGQESMAKRIRHFLKPRIQKSCSQHVAIKGLCDIPQFWDSFWINLAGRHNFLYFLSEQIDVLQEFTLPRPCIYCSPVAQSTLSACREDLFKFLSQAYALIPTS
ncbi:hypothetical protein HGRIS_013586 [Hohenbuehelia grisea]|uniref:BTB domain-containing protein n=1 Tax=Hohenbuehelia grisea TaxID=104357 RepID=A0ABR3IVZ8_9AGAR